MHNRAEIRNTVLVCIALAAAVLSAFWPVTNADFVNLDDTTYVSENVRVQQGLNAENVKWAFTTFHGSLWHPLTWLSVMLDCQLFGVNPPAMHRVNLGIHLISTVLLFLALRRVTRAFWASVVVAALFGLHPLRVESVAWIAERKDVLSTLFFILTFWAYAEYTMRRCAGFYVGSIVLFALGLMSKAMLVTVPFVLLLADLWPLQRINFATPRWWEPMRKLALEKLPFFALTGVSVSLTLLAPSHGEGMVELDQLPLTERMENAIVSYARYLGKTFWPDNLAVYYPHPWEWPTLTVLGSAALLLAISALAVATVRRWPWLFAGWFWFAGMLVPVIGIVQVGTQAMADRFSYLPSIGLLLAIVWTAREVVSRWPRLRIPGVLAALAALMACGLITHNQAGVWKDSHTLFAHAAKITAPSTLLLNSMGDAYLDKGEPEKALEKFRESLKVDPEDALAWGNIGNHYFRNGKLDEAIEHYQRGLRYKPKGLELHYNLGLALAAKGQFTEAIQHLEQTLSIEPFHVKARLNLGNVHMSSGNLDAAITNFLVALKLKPDYAPAHYNLASAYFRKRDVDNAIKHFAEAGKHDAKLVDAPRQLAAALQEKGRDAEAVPHLERARDLSPSSVGIRAELGALLSQLGRTQGAIAEYRAAIKIETNLPAVLNNLAWILATDSDATLRDGAEAVRLAEQAVALTERKQALLLGTLGATYAEAGRFEEAAKAAQEAIEVAERNGQDQVAAKNRELLAAYRERRAWREPGAPR